MVTDMKWLKTILQLYDSTEIHYQIPWFCKLTFSSHLVTSRLLGMGWDSSSIFVEWLNHLFALACVDNRGKRSLMFILAFTGFTSEVEHFIINEAHVHIYTHMHKYKFSFAYPSSTAKTDLSTGYTINICFYAHKNINHYFRCLICMHIHNY